MSIPDLLSADPLNIAGLGVSYRDDVELWNLYNRVQFEVAFAGAGRVFGIFVGGLEVSNLVGFSIWYEPGRGFLADDTQLRYWSNFAESLKPELKSWWTEEMLPRYNKLTDEGLGEGNKHNLLHLQVLGVHPGFQRQGLGSALVKHRLSQSDADGVSTCLETEDEDNLPFYKKLGYTIKAQVLIPSPHGDFTTWCFYREAPTQ
ncbi:GNAT family acetyltransferase [Ceratobasidium sp. AG-Ba]|nr:GNAT family acetyltransferase [Ceratobasidium sp. AG-Ba]